MNANYLNGYATATANTVNSVVLRDASGNFSAGTITATLTGTASNATQVVVTDSRNTTTTPQTINQGVVFDFKANSTESLSDGGTYFGEMTFRQYGTSTDWTGGLSHQLGFTDNGNIWQRSGSSTSWGSWKKLLDSSNYNSYAPTLTGTGASGSWSISVTGSSASCSGNAATATNISNSGTVTLATATEQNSIYISQPSYTTDQPVKLLNFDWYGNTWSLGNIRSGSTASNGFGVYSSGTERARFTTSGLSVTGTITASSNITAYSDIRLKKNIITIPNALDKVLNLRGVEYDRIDSEEHHIGVIAQEIETIIPEVINTDIKSGYKTVAYGNLAGLFIEAIKQQNEVINKLKEEIDILKSKLNQ